MLPNNSMLCSLKLSWNAFSNQGVAEFVSVVEPSAHMSVLDFSGNKLTQGVGRSLYALAHKCTKLTQLRIDYTFLGNDENEALEGILKRNAGLLPRDTTTEVKAQLAELEERAVVADQLLARLNTEKKAVFQLHSKIEALRTMTNKAREDGINEYIRITNSVAQCKRRETQVRDEEMRKVEKSMASGFDAYSKTLAARRRHSDADLEGYAWQLSILNQAKTDNETVNEAERKTTQHLLNDLDSMCTRKEFAIKKHQKFRQDMIDLLKNDERYLPSRIADASWDLLEKDPTLAHEERVQKQRANLANR